MTPKFLLRKEGGMHADAHPILTRLGIDRASQLAAVASRDQAVLSTHLGRHALHVATLLDTLREPDAPRVPRSGHLGNWGEIATGRAGALDFNQAVCAGGYGFPLIHCFNQTECAAGGDQVYLPGSLVCEGRRTVLRKWTWNGGDWALRDDTEPLFCPFVLTEHDGQRIPLVALHWQRMMGLADFAFELEAATIFKHREQIVEMLTALLDIAAAMTNSRRALMSLIRHCVSIDGRVAACECHADGSGFRIGDVAYPTAKAVADAAMLPFQIAAAAAEGQLEPRGFPSCFPSPMPILSSQLIGVFSAICMQAHGQPLNLHLHWGARDMAGYPPRRGGYFFEEAAQRSLRWICRALVDRFPEVAPLCFVILPASIFMLCPPNTHPRDAQYVDALFLRLIEAAQDLPDDDPNTLQALADHLAATWLARHGGALSPYFLARFSPGRGVLHPAQLPDRSSAVITSGFRKLELRQACALVGALMMHLSETPCDRGIECASI